MKFTIAPRTLTQKMIISFSIIVNLVTAVAIYNLERIGQIEAQIGVQNNETGKKQLAMELKQKAHELDVIANGLAVSGDSSLQLLGNLRIISIKLQSS